jgi:hypothetical protein
MAGVQFEKQQKKIIVAKDTCERLLETGKSSFENYPNAALQAWKVCVWKCYRVL